MNALALKQYVPSNYCLKCKGCCKFDAAYSPWRPLTNEGYIKTVSDCGNHLCQFLNKGDHTCQVYKTRPFECSLYPFIISKEDDQLKVFLHLACPYIQDTQDNPALQKHIAYVKEFFQLPATRQFLASNPGLLHDYTPQAIELMLLFLI